MEPPKTLSAGAIGARLAGRLTADLILRSPQYMSCIGEYELDLRANKITAVENLGATQNQFDSIDLTDNNVMLLEGFAKLPRLKSLYLSNNRVVRIGRGLEEAIPGLTTLILTNNRLKNLQDINPLAALPRLQYLSLLGNDVALKPQYRLYVIHRLRHLKHLDFRKVKQKEREEADRVFGDGKAEAADSAEAAAAAKTFEPGEGLPEAQGAAADQPMAQAPAAAAAKSGPTPEQVTAIKAAIQNAATLAEVAELERALVTGHMPSRIQVGSANSDDAGKEGQEAAAMEEG